jgi:glycosyltransferase involved in cell wall biosynthesis
MGQPVQEVRSDKQQMTPKVSVIIPTYNYAQYLPEAIESVLAQDLGDFELIIADDASSDNSTQLCEAYASRDSRIRFFGHETNKGMVENWNWCLSKVRGDYVKPLLGDDVLNHDSVLRLMAEGLDNHPDVSLMTSARLLIDEKSKPIGVWGPLGIRNKKIAGPELTRRCLARRSNLIGEPSSVMFRAEQSKRGFDPFFKQLVDLEMWLYLLKTGSLIYLGSPLCCFRRHPLQQTEVNKVNAVGEMESLKLYEQYYEEGESRFDTFYRLYDVKKSNDESMKQHISVLRGRLSAVDYVMCYIRYKISKPFSNLRHAILKNVFWNSVLRYCQERWMSVSGRRSLLL